ncbi:hypothetical protein [Tenuibacillus multivorans]|uniref:Uncharacterized protein n=1 Tax=Tenuibacillus multivorans TaxID=237069 RepID=A0A1G9WEJ4_9BACI|nr:hypothetical protein [Tenuibacillus multivorans]GEL76417.1 hypothetical protein TMU01_06520 [Tenuibacillus multivorans]SDM82651.1 hypothetical protein SAMN05216498_0706 [Tenuibacillus multivorans]
MQTSLIFISLTILLTFLVLYAADKVISTFKKKKSTLKIDQVTTNNFDNMEVEHR